MDFTRLLTHFSQSLREDPFQIPIEPMQKRPEHQLHLALILLAGVSIRQPLAYIVLNMTAMRKSEQMNKFLSHCFYAL